MHNQIMGFKEGYEVDHINGNKLDNRKSNLRFCTRQQNCWNAMHRKEFKSSIYKGVSKHKGTGKFSARIFVKGKVLNLGLFNTPEDAAKKYDFVAKKIRGEYAHVNFND